MTATAEAAAAQDPGAPIRPPGVGLLSKVPEGFATFFGAFGLLWLLLALFAPLRPAASAPPPGRPCPRPADRPGQRQPGVRRLPLPAGRRHPQENRLVAGGRLPRPAVQALRQGLLDRGYLEVETPMLQQIHGGADARLFTTHINAYDLDLHLRIAPELYMKRLCVGGLEKVFDCDRAGVP